MKNYTYYHLNIFGKHWIVQGKKLFKTEKRAVNRLYKLIKESVDFWKKEHGDYYNNGQTLAQLESGCSLRTINNKSATRMFLNQDFKPNKKLLGLEDEVDSTLTEN